MLKNPLKSRPIAGIIIGILITMIISGFLSADIFQKWHLKIADNLYTYNNSAEEIVIIRIDRTSTQSPPEGLGKFSQWSREYYAEILDIIGNESKVIVFDILFNSPTGELPFDFIKDHLSEIMTLEDEEKSIKLQEFLTKNSSYQKNEIDENFSKKLDEFDNIVLAFSSNYDDPIYPLEKFKNKTDIGDIVAQFDEDGILRKTKPFYQSKQDIYGDLAVESVKKYLGADSLKLTEDSLLIVAEEKSIKIPLENDAINVNYFTDPGGYKAYSFVDVINGEIPKETFKDKIVLIGVTSNQEIQDTVLTPRSTEDEMPGVEFRANEIQTILDQKFLTNQSTLSQILTIAGISIALSIILNYLGILLSILVAIMVIIGYYLSAHGFYKKGIILNMIYPFMAILLTYIASWVYKYFIADKKKREISSAFGHYVSQKLVEQISENPDMVKLGGEKKTVTVFFSDIKDSTKHSENIEITKWVKQINEYFTVMESIIKKAEGTIDKYEGDAIMGFWNAPIEQKNHISLAYLTALEMKNALKILNEKWLKEGKQPLKVRIGINTGEAIVGNFGSENRFDYTAMGDTVNTASRLESSANKTYGTSIIVAGFETLPAQNPQAEFLLRKLDTVLLPGKNEPVDLHELIGLTDLTTEETKSLVKTYTEGLEAYKNKSFTKAAQKFEQLKEDPPSQIMLERIKKLQNNEKIPELNEDMVFGIINK